ncbi:right-handed parallel beta-helix repeat-containing protein [Salinibacterium sp. SWN139]|uniref:right-handed parallel beta-helix repeat-containing protein n=1 Tax=Salinibacterium sp. SWN139 TaxID=2792055 RepID=UPI0018CD79C1|nr:right-handed parallel beta-helix repeat-containing protein [Salinibacterium sp. SWN139]MBH0052876.1 right-handed parallel beta-helix repeat-containing protein [Salinibacterium sp. SWN139]
MSVATGTTSRRFRRRQVFGAVAILLALTIAASALVVSSLGGSASTTVRPDVPFFAGVGAPENVATEAADAGAAELGTTDYEIQTGALFVSPSGDNDADGSLESPLRTIKAALARVTAGGMIVLRAGEYHEAFTIAEGTPVTVQSYPGEVVWLDGSEVIDDWQADVEQSGGEQPDGELWSVAWGTVFDSSPTYERGAPDNTEQYWNFVTARHPLAAHPDQLWMDDAPLTQVGSRDEVTASSFFHDESTGVLYIGENPSGHTVRASTLQRALSIRAEGSTIRGIGVRRFAPSVPDFGAVTVERPDVTIENVVITESATTGLFITAANTTIRQVTVTESGMIGVAANYADNLLVDGLKASGNNTEWFNRAPVAGGFKLTRSRTVEIRNSDFSDNNATALWFDQSCRDLTITGNTFVGNAGHGLFLEISARALVADNYLADNRIFGMKINDTSSVEIRDNIVVGSRNAIAVLQDERLKSDDNEAGHDERYRDDPEMTWVGTDVSIVGNTLVGSSEALIWIEDYSRTRSARDFGITVDNNLYVRATELEPRTLIAWPTNAIGVTPFSSLADFARGTGQEQTGLEHLDGSVVER